jgi:threonine/homoserine/homoserine lactone efflux protein
MGEFFVISKAIFFGIATGLMVALPLGPAGIESVKRSVSSGYKEGFKVALGAIFADLFYLLVINAGLANILNSNKRTEALFWIISGIILSLIGYISMRSHKEDDYIIKLLKDSKLGSMPFLSGFFITLSNPMTPSLWITLSGTVIRAWYYVSKLTYYLFMFSIIFGMIAWFALLNYMVLKGIKTLKPSHFHMTSRLLTIFNFLIGIGFILFGILNLLKFI